MRVSRPPQPVLSFEDESHLVLLKTQFGVRLKNPDEAVATWANLVCSVAV
jgi:hypothetical protein